MKHISIYLAARWELLDIQKKFPSFYDHVFNCPFRAVHKLRTRDLKLEQIQWFVDAIELGPVGTGEWLAKLFHIRKQTLYKWRGIKKKNGQFGSLKGGRPALIDSEEKSRLAQVLSTPGYKVKADSSYLKLVNNAIRETKCKRTGLSKEYVVLDDSKIQASFNYMRSLEKELKIDTPTANYTTKARAEACASVRNAMSFSTALYTLLGPNSDRINPLLIINVDGTVFQCPIADVLLQMSLLRSKLSEVNEVSKKNLKWLLM